MAHNLVNVLYQSVLVSIFSEWITDIDLCIVDTAFCNTDLRSKFEVVISKCSLRNLCMSLEVSSLEWIKLRGLRLSVVDLTEKGFKEWSLLQEIISRSTRIEHLAVSSPNYAAKVLNICSSIKSFRFVDNSVNVRPYDDPVELLIPLFKSFINLTSLQFKTPNPLSLAVCECIAETFPNLQEFKCDPEVRGVIVEKCRELRSLHFAYCPVVNCIRESALRSLHIGYNIERWENANLFSISDNCPHLTDLSVNYEVSEPSVLHFIRSHPQLRSLKLPSSLTKTCLQALAEVCKNLVCLEDSCATFINDDGLIALSVGCKNLTRVNFSYAKITDTGLIKLAASCPQLREVCVQCTNIEVGSMAALLKNCPGFLSLNASTTVFSTSILDYLLRSISITSLSIQPLSVVLRTVEGCFGLPNAGGYEWLNAAVLMPSLTSLTVNSKRFDDYDLSGFLYRCPFLQELNLHDCDISAEGIGFMATCKQKFKCIRLTLPQVSDSMVLTLVEAQSNLTELDLCLIGTTDKSLEHIARHCTRLKKCRFGESHITSVGVITLLLSCSTIQHASFYYCRHLTSEFLFVLIQRRRSLMSLRVWDCDISGYEGKAFLREVTGDVVCKFECSFGTFYPN